MAIFPHNASPQMPEHLVAAMESECLTDRQLHEIVHVEAEQLGLTYDEAIERAWKNTLPKNPAGSNLQFHILMLLS